MLEDGLSFPQRGDSALGRIVVGGLLAIFSFLILPALALFGYFLRVLAVSARGEEEPPAFEDWAELIVDGLKALVVSIVYGIVPFLVFAVAAGVTGAGAGAASNGGSAGGVLAAAGVLGLLVGFVMLIVMYYLIPAALTNMALEGTVGAAFDFDRLKDVLLSVDYLIAWLLPFVIAFLVNIISMVIVFFTLGLGIIVIPFVQFYFQVSIAYMFGRAFGNVVSVPQSESSTVDSTPAVD